MRHRGGALRSANHTRINAPNRNRRDLTADQQSNTKGDIELTRSIRQALMNDRSLSTAAHNITIVSVNGRVTLRGPVKSLREKAAIDAKAEAIAGKDKVDNDLNIGTRD